MKKILLSICIPTYNRAEYIGEAIESVLNQITDDIKGIVEICVSDNASTDNTEEIVNRYQKKTPCNIIYHKNEENIGADRNFLKVVEIANGEYCWLLGSDDGIELNAIKYILNLFDKNKKDFYLVGRNVYTKDMNKILNNDNKFDNIDIYDFKTTFDLVNLMFIYLGFLSAYVFKKSTWENIIKNDDNYLNYFNAYIHVYIIISSINNKKYNIAYINKPLIKYRSDNDSFLNDMGNIKRIELDINGYLKICSYLLDKKDFKLFKSKLLNQHIINKLIDLKIQGVDISSLEEKIQIYYNDFISRSKFVLLKYLNVHILIFLRKLKKVIK